MAWRILVLLLFVAQSACAQSFFSKLISRLDSIRQERLRANRPLLFPFIAPSYAPETSFAGSLGGFYSFSLRRDDPQTLRSNLPFSLSYSLNNSLIANLRNELFGPGDRWRLDGEFWLRDMPYHFYGVGYREAKDIERSATTTLYERFYWQVLQRFFFRLGQNWYLGPAIHFNETNASDLAVQMRDHPIIQAQGVEHLNMGIGFSARFDTRDMPLNAYSGTLIAFTLFSFLDEIGSDNEYTSLELDYRSFRSLWREGSTLAWQVRSRMVVGQPPWPEYSQLGSPFDLRGYYWGRFRDRVMVYGMLEYRYMFERRRPNAEGSMLSSHGFATWVALGTIAPNWASLRYYLPNVGIGYRLQVAPRTNIRLDLGVGVDEVSIYLNFAEAF